MATAEAEDKPAPSPLDAERTRLRKDGYTDAEISQILIARASGGSPQSIGAGGQGVLSNVLSSLMAVWTHARAALPSVRKDVATIFDGAAPTPARAGASASLAVKAVVIAVLGYAAWQEWNQHIISNTEKVAADAQRAKVEAGAIAQRPCVVQGPSGCLEFGLNAAEAEAAAKTSIFKGMPTAVPVAPFSEPNADKQKEIQAVKDRIQILRTEREAHGLTNEQTEELEKLMHDNLKARGLLRD